MVGIVYPDRPLLSIGSTFGMGKDGMHGQEYNLGVPIELAHKFFQTKLPPKVRNNLNGEGRTIIQHIFGKGQKFLTSENPYLFCVNNKGEETFLLRIVNVPGNATELGIDGNELERISKELSESLLPVEYLNGEFVHSIVYVPHNIDSFTQAAALLALTNNWISTAYAATRERTR
ncbi:hypothetical protein HYT24_00255 [Candidatus Pacearchaeota archaeon]|nr:hypothetical protein [Candidatus Pacearchaeota archaeon]